MALNEENEHEFQYNDLPKCPHCGDEYNIHDDPSGEYYEEGEIEMQCGSCAKDFKVSVNVTFDYTTDRDTQDED